MSKIRFSPYGGGAPSQRYQQAAIPAQRAPTTNDTNFDLGQPWVYNEVIYFYVGGGVWATPDGSGSFASLAVTGAITGGTTITAGTGLTSTTGPITATNGNVVLGTAGNKLQIATGTNASIGTSGALASGTVTVSTSAVTASSIILLSRASAAGTLGNLSVGTITAGTSFTITSSNNADTSTVNWLIIN